MNEKFDFFYVIKQKLCKKEDKTAMLLHNRRLSNFKNISKKARLHHRNTVHRLSTADVLHMSRTEKNEELSDLQQEINAYKAVIDSRSNGLSVRLARKLINYIHDDLKISSKDLINSDGTDDDAISHKDFLSLMEETLEVPFTHNELLQIVHLLDPLHTQKITVHALVAFYRSKWDKVILSSSIIMFILYPTTARNIFKLVSCRRGLDTDESTAYLIHDLNIQCWSNDHMLYFFFVGLPGLILYVIGFPLVSIFAMFGTSSGKKVENKWDDKSLYRYSMFLNGYRVEKFYWECIVALRKSTVTFVGVYFSVMGVYIQTYIGLAIIFVFMMAHVDNMPFEDKSLNMLETCALAVSFMTLYLGLMFWTGFLKGDETIPLTVAIVVMNVAFSIWALRMIFAKTIDENLKNYREAQSIKNRKIKVKPTNENGGKGGGSKKKDKKMSTSPLVVPRSMSSDKQSKVSKAEELWTVKQGGNI